jgi:hypothetical protein
MKVPLFAAVALTLSTLSFADPIPLTFVRSDDADELRIEILNGKILTHLSDRNADSVVAFFFEDSNNPNYVLNGTLSVESHNTLDQADGRRNFLQPRLTALVVENVRFKNGVVLTRRISNVPMSLSGAITKNQKTHTFGLQYTSPEIPGERGGKEYRFVGMFEPRMSGDVTEDGEVDLDDLNAVRNNFGSKRALAGDTDFDGDVDLNDLNTVRSQTGTGS